MGQISVVGFAGNITRPSKTRSLVGTALDLVSERLDAGTTLFDVLDFGDELGRARSVKDLSAEAQQRLDQILNADALIVATPIYKASYPGLFKHLIDLIDPAALLRKPVLIAATGGGDRHALAVEHQLRPLFAFFEARVLSTAVHVSDKDFTDGVLSAAPALTRLSRAVDELDELFPRARLLREAAE